MKNNLKDTDRDALNECNEFYGMRQGIVAAILVAALVIILCTAGCDANRIAQYKQTEQGR